MALVICVNRKALNSHIWVENGLRSCKAHFVVTLCREVCICHACYKQALTNVNNPTFQPRWKPKQALPKAICSVDICDETVYRNTNMASREQIQNLVGQKTCYICDMLLPLVLHSVSPTICMSITACMQDNHAHPVVPNLKEEKKTISDTVLPRSY